MQHIVVVLAIALFATADALPEAEFGVRDVIPGIGEYYFNGIPANWTTAYRQCQASGGHLAVLNSRDEMLALQEMMNRHGASIVLVGFHDQFVEGVYTFITGRSVPANTSSDSLWNPGHLIGGNEEDCGYLSKAGIFDNTCVFQFPFICELSADQGGQDIYDGFALLDGFGYYKFHNVTVPWEEAWDTCQQERSELLVLDSAAEITALWNAFNKFEHFVWLGVHRLWGPDDGFVSVRNIPLSQLGYQQWFSSSEPEGNYQSHPYLGVHSHRGMATSTTSSSNRFFCKRPLL